jgi:flagellar basal-body rod modification protein FlgD
MTDTVAAAAGTTVTSPITDLYARPREPEERRRDLDKDAFLKLLFAQLKYQDPLQPTSNEEFIATTAQFTAVEKLTELAKQGSSAALITALSSASSLLGRSVTANRDGETITATVERSQVTAGEVVLITDQGPIRLDQIVGIGPAQPATTAPPATDPGDTQPADPGATAPEPPAADPATTDNDADPAPTDTTGAPPASTGSDNDEEVQP